MSSHKNSWKPFPSHLVFAGSCHCGDVTAGEGKKGKSKEGSNLPLKQYLFSKTARGKTFPSFYGFFPSDFLQTEKVWALEFPGVFGFCSEKFGFTSSNGNETFADNHEKAQDQKKNDDKKT